MENDELSGIERELVLQYLIDGNVPVTLTPVEPEKKEPQVHSLSSAVFPVALKAEHIKVSENGVIRLENPPQSVIGFAGKQVKVEFYFNKVGLFFVSEVTSTKQGLSVTLPAVISRIQDTAEDVNYDFSALIYFEVKSKADVNIRAVPWPQENLFARPVWKSIPLENQRRAKEYLEEFVSQAKAEKNAGNGLQLIPVCNFLTFDEPQKMEAVEGRAKPVSILYVDHERIVFGAEQGVFLFRTDSEYGVKLSFSIKNSPILSRDIFVTCFVNKIYEDSGRKKYCADCRYTNIQEEDMRFVFEKATSRLFI